MAQLMSCVVEIILRLELTAFLTQAAVCGTLDKSLKVLSNPLPLKASQLT